MNGGHDAGLHYIILSGKLLLALLRCLMICKAILALLSLNEKMAQKVGEQMWVSPSVTGSDGAEH